MRKINMKRIAALFMITAASGIEITCAQEGYGFKKIHDVEASPVKSQDNTGTCWSYSTISFLESELIRKGKGMHDLSEMFNARMIYEDKADNFVRRQGKAQFSQGSLGHDVLRVIEKHGMVPQEIYSGLVNGEEKHNHTELENVLTALVTAVNKESQKSSLWRNAVSSVLDVYLGAFPEKFKYQNKEYTPRSFADAMGIKVNEYISISSFNHHPFQSWFVLEVPDNYSNGRFWNVPLDEFIKITDYALSQGVSIAWDADVSEKTFSNSKGIAIWPAKDFTELSEGERSKLFNEPVDEMVVTQEIRQNAFDSQETTDDHLMHLTGKYTDSKGNVWYRVKNSWGEAAGQSGYMYVSLAYFKLKTISILLHKDGVPKDTWQKAGM